MFSCAIKCFQLNTSVPLLCFIFERIITFVKLYYELSANITTYTEPDVQRSTFFYTLIFIYLFLDAEANLNPLLCAPFVNIR